MFSNEFVVSCHWIGGFAHTKVFQFAYYSKNRQVKTTTTTTKYITAMAIEPQSLRNRPSS